MAAEFFIACPGDFESLEARIAAEMDSSPERCAFLRTALFRHLRLHALYRGADAVTEDMVIPTHTGMVVRLVRGSKLVKLEWPPLREYSGWGEESTLGAGGARGACEMGGRVSDFIESVQAGRQRGAAPPGV